jgi:2-dehydro-3-deoxyphosphogalactonate aldolase
VSARIPWPRLRRGLVAILRGVRPEEVTAIGEAIFESGIEVIEIPLNSPRPFDSVELLARHLPAALIGAGTVLSVDDVKALDASGGRIMVSPNVDSEVIASASGFGMVTMPGVFSPTEALAALRAGASALKFFPASTLGPKGIAAIRAVLPQDCVIGAVGGVSEADLAAYSKIGVAVFGLGSSLYAPALGPDEIGARARRAVAEWDAVFGGTSDE